MANNDITMWAITHVVMLFLGICTMSQNEVVSRELRMS